MSFEFINHNASIDDASRKRIRVRVALGRNKGRKLCRRSRNQVTREKTSQAQAMSTQQTVTQPTYSLIRIDRPIDDGLFFSALQPGESKAAFKQVIKFMSSMQLCAALDDGLKYVGIGSPLCVQFMFLDEACYHSGMATAIHGLNNLIHNPEGGLEVMQHVAKTFHLMNQRLSSHADTATSDLTVAAIVNMAQYEQLHGRYRQGHIHVQGLRRIAQLRGGILKQLATSSPHLMQKILRVDLEYSLYLGSPTLFTIKEASIVFKGMMQLPSHSPGRSPGRSKHSIALSLTEPHWRSLCGTVRELLEDAFFLTSLLNDAIANANHSVDAAEFYESILLLGFRLIHFRPLKPCLGASSLDTVVHLGIISVVVTCLQGHMYQVVDIDLLSESLLSAARSFAYEDGDSLRTVLWLLFIGAACSPSLAKNVKWVTRTSHTLKILGLSAWEDVALVLADFPWVFALHDPAGNRLLKISSNLEFGGTEE